MLIQLLIYKMELMLVIWLEPYEKNRFTRYRINDDGTKLFVIYHGDEMMVQLKTQDIKEYNLSTPYDLSTITLVTMRV